MSLSLLESSARDRHFASGRAGALGVVSPLRSVRFSNWVSKFWLLILLVAGPAVSAVKAADIHLIPIGADVPHTILGDEIVVEFPQATVTVEIKANGWGASMLRAYQATIASSGYTTGTAGSLAPLTIPNAAAGAFITSNRADFVHFGFSSVPAVDTSGLDYKFGSTTFDADGPLDDGSLRYLGTLKLKASPNALGTFTVGFKFSGFTYLLDQNNLEILPLVPHPIRITVRPRIYVDRDAPGANNGQTWANAFLNLQDALAIAPAGSEVWVAAGVYEPDQGVGITPGNRAATFQMLNGVAIYGGFGGFETSVAQRNPAANVTVLSGDLSGNDLPGFGNYDENSIHVATGSGTDATAILDGFTITGGNADGANSGGGMLISSGSPTVRQNRYLGNRSANSGGGMYVASSGSLKVVDSLFAGNQANGGGGIHSESATILIANCSFHGNSSTGLSIDGGGAVNVRSGSATLTNCIMTGNSAPDFGGGILFSTAASGFMRNCSVVGNSVATSGVGGVHVHAAASSLLMENGVVHGNTNGQIGGTGTVTVNYSLIQGGFAGTQNIDADPLFVDADGADTVMGTEDDNLRLTLASPCIDAGDRTVVPADAADLDGDGNTSEQTPVDLDGNPRFRNQPTVADTGAGGIPVVDMGAYESQPPFVDCNNNGVPDDIDIYAGTSLDINADGVPDECAVFDDGCFPVPDWSCPDNWDLGGTYPDNNVDTYSVVLEGPAADVCLDVTVEINSLLIQNGASLDMSGAGGCAGDLVLSQPGGLVVDAGGTLTLGPGQTITEPASPSSAGMTIGDGGAVIVEDSTIALTGDVVIEAGGTYGPAGPPEENSATLTADSLTIQSGAAGGSPPGQMELTGTMALTVTGDLVLDGTEATLPCGALRADALVLGGHTPPIVRVRNEAGVSVGGTAMLFSVVEITHASATPMQVAGNFDNFCISGECFDFSAGAGIILDGGGSAQSFEVASTDLGGVGDVYLAPFVFPALTVQAGGQVAFVDHFDNDQLGQTSCGEAAYVDVFQAEAGSTITLDNCRVYFETANIDPSVVIQTIGCGQLLSVNCAVPSPPAPEPNAIDKSRFVSFVPGNAGVETAIRVTLTSLHHPNPAYTAGSSIPFTGFEGQVMWVGPPVSYVESVSSGTPFFASALQCTPHYQDWGTVGLLHVTGPAITPSSEYDVQLIAAVCDSLAEDYFSSSLHIRTARWGDVVAPFNPPPTTTQPDTGDISSLVNKFRSAVGAPIKARAMLAGNSRGAIDIAPDVGFTHISACVDAFRGLPYPYKPGKCTGNENKACATSTDCTALPNPTTGPCVLCP